MLQRIMNAVTWFIYILLLNFYIIHLQLIVIAADNTSYVPLENIVLNCGSNTSELLQYDGRNWTGDIDSPYVPSNADIKSLIARAPATLSIPEVPYMTARIFQSQFTYKINITPGPKFIRLHFYPASYLNLNISEAFLSVSAGNFTLLHNFSVSLNTDYFKSAYLMKEFIVHVSGNTLELTFSPSSNASDAYAFVNGIEVVSMPLGLYIRGDDAPIPLVGHNSNLEYIYDNIAMENLYRLNVGGEQILPRYDTGMFRTWDTDNGYVFVAQGILNSNMSMPIVYANNVPAYTAPEDVYRTSRSMAPFENGLVNLNYNQTWLLPVDSGFSYLIRLHFCETSPHITRINEVVFSVFLYNQTADEQLDPIGISGGPGAAVYQDYVVLVPEDSEGKQDLWLDLHPYKNSKPMYYTSYLNGVEIFKLSTVDEKSLAGLNPFQKKSSSSANAPHVVSKAKSSKKLICILIGCGLGAVAIPILLCLVLFRLKVIRPRRLMSWCGLIVLPPNQIEKANKSSFWCHFSIREIRVASNDFDEALLIGTGGFGSVYKGSFDGGETFVAIKRANPMSEQGATEFETEINLLSQLRHNNLVPLLGYCDDNEEMILVYDFMANGTLYNHLHLRLRDQPFLSWIQRLEICIGVARGLHYLHTGTQQRIIHRDIKTTNILLDHNWVAKISDFGLSKASYPSLSTSIVKGSTGYLDPEYYQCRKLTEKSDLYSLGVVLLEVLSARPAISPCENGEHLNLAELAVFCFENGDVWQIVDPNLEGDIDKECFELYLGVAMKCLAEKGVERPSSGDVLQKLYLAMQLQKNAGTVRERNIDKNDNSGLQGFSDLTLGIEFSEIMMPIGR